MLDKNDISTRLFDNNWHFINYEIMNLSISDCVLLIYALPRHPLVENSTGLESVTNNKNNEKTFGRLKKRIILSANSSFYLK